MSTLIIPDNINDLSAVGSNTERRCAMSTSTGTNGARGVAETNGQAAPHDTTGEGVDLDKGVEGGTPINTTAQPPRPQPPRICYLAPQDKYYYQNDGEDIWHNGNKTLIKAKLRKAGIVGVELYLEEIRKTSSIERVEYEMEKSGIVEVDGEKVLFQKPLGVEGLGLPRLGGQQHGRIITSTNLRQGGIGLKTRRGSGRG